MTTPTPPNPGDPYQPPGQGYPDQGAYQAPGGEPASGGFPPPQGQPFPPPGQPYPPQGQPYPPQGQPYPPQGGAYPPGTVPPPPKKKNNPIIIVAALVVVAAIVAFVVIRQNKTETASANAGDCIKITSATLDPLESSQTACTDSAAIYVVTATGGTGMVCDSHEASYVEGKDTSNPSTVVCLRPNLKVGDCWDPGIITTQVPKKEDCSAASGLSAQKLVALITTSSDDSMCPETATKSLPLTERKMVYCFGPTS